MTAAEFRARAAEILRSMLGRDEAELLEAVARYVRKHAGDSRRPDPGDA